MSDVAGLQQAEPPVLARRRVTAATEHDTAERRAVPDERLRTP